MIGDFRKRIDDLGKGKRKGERGRVECRAGEWEMETHGEKGVQMF